jgi:uncharacterized YigZ family protein
MSQGYQVLAAPCEYQYEEKRSTFTAVLAPVAEREAALAHLAHIRRERPGASHYCWAYILGSAYQPHSMAFNDDGEPGGTAGKPMLNVLEHRQAGNCMAVVVRTFGGTKLGAGGLVRAYGAAVSGALDAARWRWITPSVAVTIMVSFALEERVRHCLEQHGMGVLEAQYSTQVALTTEVPEALYAQLQTALNELTSGAVVVRSERD